MILGMDGILEWLLCLPILCRISVGKCVPFSNNKQLYITVFHFESKKDSTNNYFFTRDNITDLFYDQPIPYTWGRPGTVSDIFYDFCNRNISCCCDTLVSLLCQKQIFTDKQMMRSYRSVT